VLSAGHARPRIGIDASRTTSTASTGTEGYSYHLITALLPLLHHSYDITLYFRDYPPPGEFSESECKVMPFPRLWTHIRLSWEMLRYNPDLLFVPAHVLPLVHPRKSLVTVHDLGYRYFPKAHPGKQRLYLELSTRWNATMAAHVLADSVATRDALVREYHLSPGNITVVYPGYNSQLFHQDNPDILTSVKTRYGIQDQYILHIGRVQPRKNLTRLIGAFHKLLSIYPNMQLVLAGPTGWMAQPIIEYVQRLGMKKNVLFPGYIAEEDKAALISGARIFAYPSLYEGFGFPALEAQACGTPLLTSTTSSLPEVAGDGALYIDPEDEDAITNGLRRLLADENLRADIIRNGYENLKRFCWKKTAEKVRDVIEVLLVQS
jgi:glycosyltransferase involved in cell wall biosynthesis